LINIIDCFVVISSQNIVACSHASGFVNSVLDVKEQIFLQMCMQFTLFSSIKAILLMKLV
jgi:hypothetical protein